MHVRLDHIAQQHISRASRAENGCPYAASHPAGYPRCHRSHPHWPLPPLLCCCITVSKFAKVVPTSTLSATFEPTSIFGIPAIIPVIDAAIASFLGPCCPASLRCPQTCLRETRCSSDYPAYRHLLGVKKYLLKPRNYPTPNSK